jgi:hypothetical protein
VVIFRSQKGCKSKKSLEISVTVLPCSGMRRFLGICFLVELPPNCECECSDILKADGDILFSLVSLMHCVDSWCLEFRSVSGREHGAFSWDGTVRENQG